MSEQPANEPRATILLHAARVPFIVVAEDDGESRGADTDEVLAQILASQLRVETMVRDTMDKVGPTLDGLAKHPLLSRLFG